MAKVIQKPKQATGCRVNQHKLSQERTRMNEWRRHTRPSNRLLVHVLQVAHLVLDICEERDIDRECDEREKGSETGGDGGKEHKGYVRAEGEQERDEGHDRSCRTTYQDTG